MKTITLPGSKSITNRDLILAALSDWESRLRGYLESEDTEHMIHALNLLGIRVQTDWDELIIHGGIQHIRGEWKELFLGNSGTSVRFLTSLAILNTVGNIIITGEERMKERPIKDLIDGISQLWADIHSNNWFCPLIIGGINQIEKSHIVMNGDSSSQYFTSILQVSPLFKNGLILEVDGDLVSKPYLDITIHEMKKYGVEVTNENYKRFLVHPQTYHPVNMNIEGDASAMSYFAAFMVLHGGEIKINNLSHESKQGDYHFIDTLAIFWLSSESDKTSTILRAPWIQNLELDQYTEYSIDFENMPDVSLTFMILAIFLPGNTRITGLKTLNLKESKRIDSMRNELQKLWIFVDSDNDSIMIWEFKGFRNNTTIDIEAYKDHRIAMSFGILGSFIWNLSILNPRCVAKTYPKFWEDLENIMNI